VRVDSRGCGCSPGVIDHFSPRETKDFHDCIEWAGVQPWSSGKVGLNGISYYGINQWHVASLRPPHLARQGNLHVAEIGRAAGPHRRRRHVERQGFPIGHGASRLNGLDYTAPRRVREPCSGRLGNLRRAPRLQNRKYFLGEEFQAPLRDFIGRAAEAEGDVELEVA